MKAAPDDLPNRRPVWEALSDLFLYTDVTLARTWRAEKLAASPYSLADIEQILIDEVYPVCKYNLVCVAGEWEFFDPDWLENRILNRLKSPLRGLHWLNAGRFWVPRCEEWQATKTTIISIRESSNSA
ncbi:hypothetical protein [Methylomicrobium lacus]|uniref:DUF7079 family protein n=1 Tax=Methylomicrobium lacus TaxID=136992 RepID=UPI0035A9A721